MVTLYFSLIHKKFFYISAGIFIPPVSGTYLLIYYAAGNDGSGDMIMKRDAGALCTSFVGDEQGEKAVCTAIVELSTSDKVRITGNSNDQAKIRGGSSGFAGHLLQAVEA